MLRFFTVFLQTVTVSNLKNCKMETPVAQYQVPDFKSNEVNDNLVCQELKSPSVFFLRNSRGNETPDNLSSERLLLGR